MKNNKKKVFYVILILVAVVTIILIFINQTLNNKNHEDELLLECSNTVTLDDSVRNSQKIELYKNEDALKLFQISSFDLSNDLSEKQSELLFTMVEQNLKNRINNEFGNFDNYVDFTSKKEEKKLYFKIIYTINQTNYDKMKRIFDLDLYNSEKEEIIRYFEEEGFNCVKY